MARTNPASPIGRTPAPLPSQTTPNRLCLHRKPILYVFNKALKSFTRHAVRYSLLPRACVQNHPVVAELDLEKTNPFHCAVVAHGGGPTAVLNASLAGVIDACRRQGIPLLGAQFGIAGILKEQFYDLSSLDPNVTAGIRDSPASAIGSSRVALSADQHECILDLFRKHRVRWFFYTGGNGSMETALTLHRMAIHRNDDVQILGIPKTIDNDLAVTDHSPGYASAARFFAHAARDIGQDNRSLPSPVCILETLGRNTGWIVAATALARGQDEGRDDAPHLIYFPERRLSLDRIAADVEGVYRRLGRVVVAVCEGQLDESGQPFGADVDRAGSSVHRLASNLGHTLAQALSAKLGLRARAEKPGLLGRSCEPLVSAVDRAEAYACGETAVNAASRGESGKMITLRRISNSPYASQCDVTELDNVARIERCLPDDWITVDGNDVNRGFIEYIRPLIGKVHTPFGLLSTSTFI